MSSAPRITAKPAPGITPDQARNIRARAWAFASSAMQRKRPKGGSHRPTATTIRKVSLDMTFAPPHRSISDRPPEFLMILFKIISRRSWDALQDMHQAFPGSRVEHLMEGTGLYVLHVPVGGAKGIAE